MDAILGLVEVLIFGVKASIVPLSIVLVLAVGRSLWAHWNKKYDNLSKVIFGAILLLSARIFIEKYLLMTQDVERLGFGDFNFAPFFYYKFPIYFLYLLGGFYMAIAVISSYRKKDSLDGVVQIVAMAALILFGLSVLLVSKNLPKKQVYIDRPGYICLGCYEFNEYFTESVVPAHGEYKVLNKHTEALVAEATYRNGRRDGVFKLYKENGQLIEEIHYKNNVQKYREQKQSHTGPEIDYLPFDERRRSY